MSPLESQVHEVIETTSAEEASQLRRKGWLVLAVGKGHDDSGEACLKFSLGWKHSDLDPLDSDAANASFADAPFPPASEKQSS